MAKPDSRADTPYPPANPTVPGGSVRQPDRQGPKSQASQRPRGQARLGLRLAAVALMALSGIAAWFVFNQADSRQDVIQVAADVSRGEVIEASDLRPVTTGSVQGVSTVPGNELTSLVGQKAMVDLVEGALLPAGAIAETLTPEPDSTLMGMRLDSGRIVVAEMRPQTPLRLVVTDPEGAQPGEKYEHTGQEYRAILIHSEPAVDGGATLVDVQVSQTDAAEIARLAAAKRISVLQDPEE